MLGSMLIDADCVKDVMDKLRPSDFYLRQNRDIFETIYSMFNFSLTIDPVTVLEHMKQNGVYDENTSRGYLLQLMDTTPTAANVVEYIGILKDKTLLRRVAEAAGDLTALIQQGTETGQDILEAAEQRIYAIRQGRAARGLIPISNVLIDVYDRLTELAASESAIPGLSTGLTDLDRAISGLNKSDLILLAARPGMGKTSFALNMLLHAGKFSGKTVVFFSLEMSGKEIAQRFICAQAMVNMSNFRTGRISPEEWANINEAIGELSRLDILIDDTPGTTVTEIRAKARRMLHNKERAVIILDYLQLVNPPAGKNYNGNRAVEVSEMSRGLKIMAKELGVPVIMLSQLNRSLEGRTGKRPQMSDLRESGSIEQDADIVMFLDRSADEAEASRDDRPDEGVTRIVVAKNRSGPIHAGRTAAGAFRYGTRPDATAATARSAES